MARRIRDPRYDLNQFFQDCLKSFPELELFFDDQATSSSPGWTTKTTASSGHAAEAEYQRTVGALFAVYWLLRLDSDGKESFCYGVDDNWNPVKPKSQASEENAKAFSQMTGDQKRSVFFNSFDWQPFSELVARAGCSGADDSFERTVALLCLTAFHDIMKLAKFRPIVQMDHAPYCGYDAGVRIHDHDVALSYVLEHFPDLLPSFAGLDTLQQRAVLFTQGQMQFNHGWFVQGEAPPGGMLCKFKTVLQSGAEERDIDLYFLHWVTDLSGAEAAPLAGAEKLVMKFPQSVLASFLWSMSFLRKLKSLSETELVEQYLEARWNVLLGSPVPSDRSAIALMRMVLMAQCDDSTKVVEAFRELDETDQKCLITELSRTGCSGQRYRSCPVTHGPAFLLYYSPALLQRNKNTVEGLRLSMLLMCIVFRAARALWPASESTADNTVTIQIASLKSTDLKELFMQPEAEYRSIWILQALHKLEGEVNLCRSRDLQTMIHESARFRILDLADSPKTAEAVLASAGTGTNRASQVNASDDFKRTVSGLPGSQQQRIVAFMGMSTWCCDHEAALVWLLAALNRRSHPTKLHLVQTVSHVRYQWMQYIFADKFSAGGDWELAPDLKSFRCGKVVVELYLAPCPSMEATLIQEMVKLAPKGSLENAGTWKEGDITGEDYLKLPGGTINSLLWSAPCPDIDLSFFDRFTCCKCIYVMGTPGGVNCPMRTWSIILERMHNMSTVLYITPQLTRNVRFPKAYVMSNPDWNAHMKKAIWDSVLTSMARRPEFPAATGPWGLTLRLNVANAIFCRNWYEDVMETDVKKAKIAPHVEMAVRAYVQRNSSDDRPMGSIVDELKSIGVQLPDESDPSFKTAVKESYQKALFENVLICIMTTDALLVQNSQNLSVTVDEEGYEKLKPRFGYTNQLTSLADFFGAEHALNVLKTLPLKRLTPAYDVVGMIFADLSLEQTLEVDGGIGLLVDEAAPPYYSNLLTQEQQSSSTNPVLMTQPQDAHCIYAAGPFG
eukprot:TRINITY_DN32918_c0_g1_i1.p1 TRINITY_DN32918_c0_g1~~TRINITY_DN32918_c0_g1_i1.p1  ORF type:complete len:1125 (+),score=179.91 TRINITY_DN32918_c0_g1_i1:341-3376(+)